MQDGKYIKFEPYFNVNERPPLDSNPKYFYKFGMISDIWLIRHILEYNGFKEIFGNWNTSWCLFWGNNNFKSDTYEVMTKD